MEQSELHSRHLNNAQVSIDFFFLRERTPSAAELHTEANP